MPKNHLLLSALLIVACTGKDRGPDTSSPPSTTPSVGLRLDPPELAKPGLTFSLSEAQRPGNEVDRVPAAEATALDGRTTAGLLARLPAMDGQDPVTFALRPGSTPPPLTGEDVQQPWPPPERPEPAPDVDPSALNVVRATPEGDVALAPKLSVTFSQPMVAVADHKTASKTVPVQLDPPTDGTWRWVGTRTALFEGVARLPMATTYTATVPKGTSSTLGMDLDRDHVWTFQTPPVTVESMSPWGRGVRTDPIIVQTFDQDIDDRILKSITLQPGDVGLRKATPQEIDAEPDVKAQVERAVAGRVLALVPTTRLLNNTTYTVTLDKGAPSAEGPRLTGKAQSKSFTTYGPLEVSDWSCWEDRRGVCNPDGNVGAAFSNALAEDQDLDQLVQVEPVLPGQSITTSGSWMNIAGTLPPRAKVQVTLKAGLKDIFGQTLGKDQVHTFEIGPARSIFSGPDRPFAVLDPAGPAALSVFSRNRASLEVEVYRVAPQDLKAVSDWMSAGRREDPPLTRQDKRTITIQAVDDQLVETAIDLSAALGESGHAFVVLRSDNPDARRGQDVTYTWVQRTRLGLTAFIDQGQVLAWVTDLATGAPVGGAEVSLLGKGGPTVSSGADGLARLGPYEGGEGPHALVATLGNDTALLPAQTGWWQRYGPWQRGDAAHEMRLFVFDDRGVVKPGETANFKGWARPYVHAPGKGLGPLDGTLDLTWTVRDSRGVELGKGKTTTTATGGFDLTMDVPGTPNLGPATLEVRTDGPRGLQIATHSFRIEEFRRPEVEVSTTVDSRPYVLGQHALAVAQAAYFTGEPLPDAETSWTVTATPGSFAPPGWQGWTFGAWTPWWRHFGGYDDASTVQTFQGRTGADGTHTLRMDFTAMSPPRPTSIRAEASVQDVNRQRWSSSSSFLVHPADRYVGLRTERSFVQQGKPVRVDVVVVDLDGKALDTRPAVTLARQVWKKVQGTWQEVDEDARPCDLSPVDGHLRCETTLDAGGSWTLTATVTDDEGRKSETTSRIWVAGGPSKPVRSVELEDVLLIPAQQDPKVGDTFEVLVQAPFWPSDAVVSVRQDGLLSTERLHLDGPSTTLELPVTEAWMPGVTLEVDLVGSAPRVDDDGNALPDATRRPAYASGALAVDVPPLLRTLAVDLKPAAAELLPGASTHIDVVVRDAAGKPMPDAEVALWIVDEAVLAVAAYQLPDPLSVFYRTPSPMVSEAHSRSLVVLADPESVAKGGASPPTELREAEGAMMDGAPGRGRAMRMESASAMPPPAPMAARAKSGLMDAEEEAAPSGAPVALRTDFRATALFSPRVITDSRGQARVPVDLPDSLTRYRVMAVAADRVTSFGTAETTVVARKALMLRPSPPRFLNVGDKAEVPFVVQNPTDRPQTVELAVRFHNGVVLTDVNVDLLSAPDQRTRGLRFVVPAEDRREVRVPVGVRDAGRLRFQAIAAAGSQADAVSEDLPIWTPATTEAFATYGDLTEGATALPVQAPSDAWPQYGGLEISTSSTQFQALTDALLYLNDYPFSCTEQIASRVLANAALRDVLTAFEAEQLPPPDVLKARVEEDLALLGARQVPTGGFGLWTRDTQHVWPWASLHATHAIVRAKEKGWTVDDNVLRNALGYARRVERHIPSTYSQRARIAIRAYAVYVRELAGDSDPGEARKLLDSDELSLEGQAWILPTLHAAGDTAAVAGVLKNWDNKVDVTAATATFAETYQDAGDYVLMHGSRRTDAAILESLLRVEPDNELGPAVVRGLLGHRKAGRWSTTQENSFVLLAMDRAFRIYESVTPDFIARTWLDQGFIGEQDFKGRQTTRSHTDIPMADLAEKSGTRTLTLATEGQGRLYYRVGLRYAPKDLSLPPADHGFTVERRYAAVDDPDDVTQDADGTWHIKAGARVRVRVDMVNTSRRTLVALVDPLPAGLEILNPALATTGTVPSDDSVDTSPAGRWWWTRTWYDHQNLRDERAEAFSDLLWPGVHTYSYVAIATTPGRYVAGAPKAEEMYHPETFGRGATDKVVVE